MLKKILKYERGQLRWAQLKILDKILQRSYSSKALKEPLKGKSNKKVIGYIIKWIYYIQNP